MEEGRTGGPTVGVVVPNKNGARFLRAAIDSILEQDYPSVSCVVMDSLSTDGSIEILRSYGDRVRWVSQQDSCAAQAINAGWAMLDAPVLAWLNSDDMWAPGAVAKVVTLFESEPDTEVVSGECAVIDESGQPIPHPHTGGFDTRRSLMKADHILDQPAVFMKRTALERVGWLREMWLHDHDLWLRLSLRARFTHLDDVLAVVREREGNLGHVPEIVGPMRIKVIEDFLARDDLPQEFRRMKRQAMCWAHLRAARVYLAKGGDLAKATRHLVHALLWDPLNREAMRTIGKRIRRRMKVAPDGRAVTHG